MTTCTHCNGTSLCQFSVIREQRQGLPCLYCRRAVLERRVCLASFVALT